MELKNILIGTVVVGMIMLGLVTYINSLSVPYSQNVDLSGFEKTANKTKELTNLSRQTYQELSSFGNWTPSSGVFGFIYASGDMIKGGWHAMGMPFRSVFLFMTVFDETFSVITTDAFGFSLPDWFLGGVTAIIFIILVIMLLEMFMRWKFQS